MNRFTKFLVVPLAGWSLLVISSFIWNLRIHEEHTREILLDRSNALCKIIKNFRLWNARQGGVYVPVSAATPPNPYLVDPLRDVTTTSGIRLTKVNPAYMTRLTAEISKEETGAIFHITSLKPIRPENRPDEWERAALEAFEHDRNERGELVTYNNAPYYRYMIPLPVDEDCLRCHARQGYAKGDIRGGLSVSFPVAAFIADHQWQEHRIILLHAAAFCAGLLAIAAIYFLAQRSGKAILDNEIKFKALFEQATESIFLMEPIAAGSPRIVDLNRAACLAHGYRREELLGKPITTLNGPETAENSEERAQRLLAGEKVHFEGTHIRKNGSEFPVEVSAQTIMISGRPFILAVDRDISERMRIEELLLKLSHQDALTGLANRRHFDEEMEKIWYRALREGISLAIIMIDIDYFKQFNDRHGHQAGDECLKQVSRCLAGAIRRAGDLLARYGGEEFVAVLSSSDLPGAVAVAETMRLALEAQAIPHADSSVSPYVTISAGVAATVPGTSQQPKDLIEDADRALYLSKGQGRNRVSGSSARPGAESSGPAG